MTTSDSATLSAGPRTDLWTLPDANGPRFRALVARGLRLRCPYCGKARLFRRWFYMAETCPHCQTRFVREDGYFLGAYAINLVVAEFLGLGAVLIVLFQMNLSLITTEVIAVSTAIGLPVLFFPWSRTLWMALDLFFDRELTRKVVRAGDIDRRP
jgi:uncharacterized protein (DUF983 family)